MSLKLISCMCAAMDLMADVNLDSFIAWREDAGLTNDQLMDILSEYYEPATSQYKIDSGVDAYEISEIMISAFLAEHPDFPSNTFMP